MINSAACQICYWYFFFVLEWNQNNAQRFNFATKLRLATLASFFARTFPSNGMRIHSAKPPITIFTYYVKPDKMFDTNSAIVLANLFGVLIILSDDFIASLRLLTYFTCLSSSRALILKSSH